MTAISATDENVEIDNLVINFTTVTASAGVDTLNGGLGDDTYSFILGDGNDIINEGVNATSGGTADRISILAPSTGIDPERLPMLTINALNAFDSNTGTQTGDLVINYTCRPARQQTITVAGHFNGTSRRPASSASTSTAPLITGYLLGADDYLISRLDPTTATRRRQSLRIHRNNFVVGEQGVNDIITGGSGNDLIFGGTGNNDLVGGLGDDLLVGGSGNDDLTPANAAGDDLEGALGADTMIGGAGNDTYGVDDLLDVVVEAANEGYRQGRNLHGRALDRDHGQRREPHLHGHRCRPVRRHRQRAQQRHHRRRPCRHAERPWRQRYAAGGLGADTMIGGDGNDVYVVDEAGDVVMETMPTSSRRHSTGSNPISTYMLGANVENLDLNGGDAINGTGNALNNIINGNDGTTSCSAVAATTPQRR